MLNPLSLVKPYTTYLLLALAAAGWAAAGVQTIRLAKAKQETAEVRSAWDADRANAQALALKTSEQYRAKEAADRQRIQTQQEAYDALQKSHVVTLAAYRLSDGKLREQIAAYARGSGAPSDTCTAESARTEALGILLSDSLRLQEELAGGAESASDAVRALKASWPNAKP